jgi:hypothetical protein
MTMTTSTRMQGGGVPCIEPLRRRGNEDDGEVRCLRGWGGEVSMGRIVESGAAAVSRTTTLASGCGDWGRGWDTSEDWGECTG